MQLENNTQINQIVIDSTISISFFNLTWGKQLFFVITILGVFFALILK